MELIFNKKKGNDMAHLEKDLRSQLGHILKHTLSERPKWQLEQNWE